MVSRHRVMLIVGIVLIIASLIPMYYSHQESVISYEHVNATTCMGVLNRIINGYLVNNEIEQVINTMGSSLLISIEVHVDYSNGTSITYGSYIPAGFNNVFITPMVSGSIEIFGRSHCAYVGDGYVVNVFIGQYPATLHLFGIGILLLIMGFALIALGDYLKDKGERGAYR
ncbi:hypothetical protein [Vulcanisaeta souniana]|nr:hypothetical protein [Vulcanisaeta souniana]